MATDTKYGSAKPGNKKQPTTEQLISKFGDTYKLVKIGSKSKVMFIDENDVGEQVWETMEYADFKRFVCNEQVRVWNERYEKYEHVPLVDEWLKSPLRKSYKGVTFLPSDKANPDFINLWTGFNSKARAPAKPDELQPFMVLVENALCAGNKTYSEYLLSYLAHMFQKPYELPGVAVVMRGKQGAGKGTLMKTLAKMVGSKHYRHVSSAEKLTSRFDGYLADCILLFADESVWGGNKQAEGTLKTMITEQELASEKKGQDILHLRNFKRLFAASNEEWAMPVGKEDRRFFVLDVSEKYLGDWDFWNSYNKWLDSGGDELLMHFFLERDITKFNLKDFPHTPGHADQAW